MTSPSSPGGPPVVPSIPLHAEPARQNGDASVGALVKEVTTHVSTLVRAEVDVEERGRERASDHAPVWIELDLGEALSG